MVEPYRNPVLTDVMVDESGAVFMVYDTEEEGWRQFFSESCKFFTSEAEAMNYARSLFPSDMDKVKYYLEYLESYEPDKLEQHLPDFIYSMYKKGMKSAGHTYSEVTQMKEALAGNININACTFRAEQVSCIKWLSGKDGSKAKIHLKNGTTILTNSDVEYEIIRAIFGQNRSGMSFTF